MKHFLLKFNHGVEIGARLAYIGHFERTQEPELLAIIDDETTHRWTINFILKHTGTEPSPIIDSIFWLIGNCIRFSCRYFPLWSLDFVAQTMETFAIFNYRKLAKAYPRWSENFNEMAEAEERHELYFRRSA